MFSTVLDEELVSWYLAR